MTTSCPAAAAHPTAAAPSTKGCRSSTESAAWSQRAPLGCIANCGCSAPQCWKQWPRSHQSVEGTTMHILQWLLGSTSTSILSCPEWEKLPRCVCN